MHTGRPQQPHRTHAWERTPQGRCTSSVRGGLQGDALGSWPGAKTRKTEQTKNAVVWGLCSHGAHTPTVYHPFLIHATTAIAGRRKRKRAAGGRGGILGSGGDVEGGGGELTRGARGGGASLAHGVTTARHHRVNVLHTHGQYNDRGLKRVRVQARQQERMPMQTGRHAGENVA